MIKIANSKEKSASQTYWKILILIVLMLNVPRLFSQDRYNVEFGIGYPFPDKKFFVYYDGVYSINTSLTYEVLENFYTGISFNFSKTKQDNPEVYTRYYIPNGIIKYKLGIVNNLFTSPEFGLGLVILNIKCSEYSYNEKQLGFDIYGKISIGFSVNNRIDLLVSYRFDYMYLQNDEDFTMLEYYRSMHLSNLCAGINFKF